MFVRKSRAARLGWRVATGLLTLALCAGCGGSNAPATTGSVKVTLTKDGTATVPTGALWMLDGDAGHASDAQVNGVTPGTHHITFLAVGGTTAPAAADVTVVIGQVATATGNYASTTGSLKVTLTPSSAKWTLDSDATQRASGAQVDGLAPGAHNITFVAVTNFATPVVKSATVVVGQVTNVTQDYGAAVKGSLKVTLAPAAAITAGAKWTLDSDTTQRASDAQVDELAPGSHTVKFVDATGWVKPADLSVTVTAGALTTASGTNCTYTAPMGTVKVDIQANGAVGAKWTLDGDAGHNSGDVVSTNVGSHVVGFSAVSGFTAPATINGVNVTLNSQTSIPVGANTTYIPVPVLPTITVSSETAAAGAKVTVHVRVSNATAAAAQGVITWDPAKLTLALADVHKGANLDLDTGQISKNIPVDGTLNWTANQQTVPATGFAAPGEVLTLDFLVKSPSTTGTVNAITLTAPLLGDLLGNPLPGTVAVNGKITTS